MFAAHLAAGLAIKAAEPRAPAWAVLGGSFLPDLIWIALARFGVESAAGTDFDGWSHSAASIVVQAAFFAALFWRNGRNVVIAVGAAVLSHLVLDFPVHPQPLQLYPYAAATGPSLWAWSRSSHALGMNSYWWLQLATLVLLLSIYVVIERRLGRPANLIGASCLIVGGLHLIV